MQMKVVAAVLLAASMCCDAKTLRWYISAGNIEANLQFVKEHREAMSGFYGCCGGIRAEADGTISSNMAALTNQTKIYKAEGLSYHLMGSVNETGVKNGKVVEAAADIVKAVVATGADGIIFDYEPQDDYTATHAQLYANFLTAVKEASKGTGLDIGMDVAGWGLLNFFSIYGASNLDIYTSMSTTYYASTALAPVGTYFIGNMTKYYGADHSFFGIGTWDTDPSTCSRDYGWNSTALQTFLTRNAAEHIDLWRCDMDGYATPSPDMIQTLQNWYQN